MGEKRTLKHHDLGWKKVYTFCQKKNEKKSVYLGKIRPHIKHNGTQIRIRGLWENLKSHC